MAPLVYQVDSFMETSFLVLKQYLIPLLILIPPVQLRTYFPRLTTPLIVFPYQQVIPHSCVQCIPDLTIERYFCFVIAILLIGPILKSPLGYMKIQLGLISLVQVPRSFRMKIQVAVDF